MQNIKDAHDVQLVLLRNIGIISQHCERALHCMTPLKCAHHYEGQRTSSPYVSFVSVPRISKAAGSPQGAPYGRKLLDCFTNAGQDVLFSIGLSNQIDRSWPPPPPS